MSSASRRSSPTSALLAPAGRRPGGESEPPTPCVPSPAESAPSSWRSSASPAESAPSSWRSSASPTASAPSSWKSSASPVASSAPRQRASPCTSQVRPSRHRAHGRVRQVRWRRPLAGDVPPRARPKSDRVGTELMEEFGKSGGVVRSPATCLPVHVPSPTASAPSSWRSSASPAAASTTSSGPSSPRQRASPSRVRPSPTWSRPRARKLVPSCPPPAGDRRKPDMRRSRLGVLALKSERLPGVQSGWRTTTVDPHLHPHREEELSHRAGAYDGRTASARSDSLPTSRRRLPNLQIAAQVPATALRARAGRRRGTRQRVPS